MGHAHQGSSQAVIPLTDDYPFLNAVGTWTHIFSPTIVNNARAGLTRLKLNASVPKDLSGLFGETGQSTAGIGLPTGWLQTQAGFAYINVSSGEGWDMQNSVPSLRFRDVAVDNNFDYNDTLNWEHGKHITKFGFEFLRYQQDYVSYQRYRRFAGTVHLQRQCDGELEQLRK